jgi:hypothetical protein
MCHTCAAKARRSGTKECPVCRTPCGSRCDLRADLVLASLLPLLLPPQIKEDAGAKSADRSGTEVERNPPGDVDEERSENEGSSSSGSENDDDDGSHLPSAKRARLPASSQETMTEQAGRQRASRLEIIVQPSSSQLPLEYRFFRLTAGARAAHLLSALERLLPGKSVYLKDRWAWEGDGTFILLLCAFPNIRPYYL